MKRGKRRRRNKRNKRKKKEEIGKLRRAKGEKRRSRIHSTWIKNGKYVEVDTRKRSFSSEYSDLCGRFVDKVGTV